MPTPTDPVALTTDVLSYLLSVPVSATLQNYLISILLSGQANNSYWTSAWNTLAQLTGAAVVLFTLQVIVCAEPPAHVTAVFGDVTAKGPEVLLTVTTASAKAV